jgi:hypothetical protein
VRQANRNSLLFAWQRSKTPDFRLSGDFWYTSVSPAIPVRQVCVTLYSVDKVRKTGY